MSNNNLDVLLKALELTEKFDVIRKDGAILIRSRFAQELQGSQGKNEPEGEGHGYRTEQTQNRD